MTTPETGDDAASPEGTVTVTEAGSGTYTQQITLGHHGLVADEPRPIGDDAGPTPYDLLLAALGSCTSMTVRKYADRKGISYAAWRQLGVSADTLKKAGITR